MNILRFKQRAQGWMAREDGESDSDSAGFGPARPREDATAYGGRFSGFDPSAQVAPEFKGNFAGSGWAGETTGQTLSPGVTGAPDNLSHIQQLQDMFRAENPDWAKTVTQLPGMSSSLGQLSNMNFGGYTTGSTLNAQTPEQAQSDQAQFGSQETPSWARRMGIVPGMSQEQFFKQESPSQQAGRMGMIGEGLGNVGSALMHTMMPAPIRMGLGLANAYRSWDPSKPMASAGRALGVLPGYAGVAGQAMQGNYGQALAGGLTKAGANPLTAAGLGMGLDKYQGKDVTAPAAGLAGYYAGSQLGGPVGGVFGQNLARMFTRKK